MSFPSIFHIVLLMFHDAIRQFDCKKDIRYGYTPRRESVCGGGRVLSSKYPGAFLMHFIEYALLVGSGGYPPAPCIGSEMKPVAQIVVGHSKELK